MTDIDLTAKPGSWLASINRVREERDHFQLALEMIEENSTDKWSRGIATMALRIIRETPSAPAEKPSDR